MTAASMVGSLLALAALLLFSTNVMVTKLASNRLSLDTGFMISVSVNILFCALLFAGESLLRADALHWDTRGFLLFLLGGIFSTWLGRYLFFEAIVRFGPARASILQITSPIFNALIAWLVMGESLRQAAIAGMALTLCGLYLVVRVPPAGTTNAEGAPGGGEAGGRLARFARFAVRSGLLMGLCGALAYAVSGVFRGMGVRHWNEPILGGLLGASSGMAMHALTNRESRGFLRALRGADRRGVLAFALSGVLTIVAQVLSIGAMKYIPVAVATLIAQCTPVLVLPMSYFLLGNQEKITGRTVLGCAMTVVGIATLMLS